MEDLIGKDSPKMVGLNIAFTYCDLFTVTCYHYVMLFICISYTVNPHVKEPRFLFKKHLVYFSGTESLI